MVQEWLLLFIGLAGLWFISSYVVEAARGLAAAFHVSPLVIGLTITSIGTSLPEIATAIAAGVARKAGVQTSGLAMGNIVGANLGQITIILGIVGLFYYLRFKREELISNGLIMISAVVVLFVLSLNGLSRIDGAVLIALYVLYIWYVLKKHKVFQKDKRIKEPWLTDLAVVVLGLVLIVFSANIMVNAGESIARALGIGDYLIGFFIGFGTSLPELTVSLRAAARKAGALSLGNLIGSNITDPLLSIGSGVVIAKLTVAREILFFDFVYWFIASLIAFFMLLHHVNLNKKEASVLILLYLLFIYLKLAVF